MGADAEGILSKRLSLATGSRIADVRVGPAGVHLDLDSAPDQRVGRKPMLSFWLQGGLRVKNQQEEKFSSPPCPPESARELLAPLLVGRLVTEAALDRNRNVLRLVLDDELLLSVYPARDADQVYPWMFYQRSQERVEYAVVEIDRIELKEEASA